MTYRDDVRRHYLHDPLCSDEHYAHLMQQAHDADMAAEAAAEVPLTDEGDDGILGGMNIIAQAATLTHQVDALVSEKEEWKKLAIDNTFIISDLAKERTQWSEACFAAEVELAHAENTIRQLRGDLAFADSSAAVDKGGAVRMVDELCAERDALIANSERLREELAQERRFKAGWVDKALAERANVHDVEELLADSQALIRTLQEELTAERSRLHQIQRGLA